MRKIVLSALALVALASCSKEQTNDLPTVSDTPIITAAIAGNNVTTRASATEWSANDAIGIYMFKATDGVTIAEGVKNFKYTADATGTNPEFSPAATVAYFPVDGSAVNFFAYYPYATPNDNSDIVFDLASQKSLPALDLMTAKVDNKSKTAPAVEFQFIHRLSLLNLNIKAGTGLVLTDLSNLEVTITKQRTAVTFDPQLNTLGAANEYKPILLNTNTEGTIAQAILMPTDVATDASAPADRELQFKLSDTGEVFRWSIPAEKEFKAGEKNIYTITLNRTGIEVASSITDWNAGNGTGEAGSAE